MRTSIVVLGTIALTGGRAVLAQTPAPGSADRTLEEVVVTAGFRELPLLAAPGSATVLGSDAIAGVAAKHLESIVGLAPNVTYSSAGARARFLQIRGIGDLEQFVDPKHYPDVGVAVDDVNLGGIASAAMLFDSERVEVLRGPQGTRFGTSALAGVVDIRSRAPTRDFEGYVTAGIADYATRSAGVAAGGPLSDAVSARIAAQKHSSDGYMRDTFLGRDDTNGYDETTIRARLRVEPTGSDAVYDLTYLDVDSDDGYDAFSLDNTRETLSDEPGFDRLSSRSLSARASWPVEGRGTIDATLTRLESDSDYGFDEDWTYVGICDGTLCDPVYDFFSNTDVYRRRRDETTLDLRWLSARRDGGFEYVAGVYAQTRDESLDRDYYGPFASDYATERRAVYAQASVPLGRRLALSAGLRLESFDDSYADSFGARSTTADTLSTGELGFSVTLGPASTFYGLISRGEKAGGVNTGASANRPFMQPQFQSFLDGRLRFATEKLTSLEAGLKGRYRDGALELRAALFTMERRDAQLESWLWDGVNYIWVGLLDNVDGRNRGLELELDSLIGRQWELSLALGVLATRVDSILTFDLDRNDFVERNGIDQAKAPHWQASVVARWQPPGDWSGRVEIRAQDDVRFGYYHDGTLGGYTLINASIARQLGRTELRLYGRNLADRDFAVHGLYFGNDPRKGWINETYYQFGEPRVVGLEFNHAF